MKNVGVHDGSEVLHGRMASGQKLEDPFLLSNMLSLCCGEFK